MIKYKRLAIEEQFKNTKEEEQGALLNGYRESLISAQGFELLVQAMRDIEVGALLQLNKVNEPIDVGRCLGQAQAITTLRAALTPEAQNQDRDLWEREAQEEFLEDE